MEPGAFSWRGADVRGVWEGGLRLSHTPETPRVPPMDRVSSPEPCYSRPNLQDPPIVPDWPWRLPCPLMASADWRTQAISDSAGSGSSSSPSSKSWSMQPVQQPAMILQATV